MDIRNIAVVGAGTMGRGIAALAALAGYKTALHDVDPQALAAARQRIQRELEESVRKGKRSADEIDAGLARLAFHADLEEACADADLVIEAVYEDLELKRSTFARLSELCGPDCVLASNTSSLPITAIAAAAERPERAIGMHFFNPPLAMKLVELVLAVQTAPETLKMAREVARRMGKETVEVRDAPGFATSRLGVVLGLEAIRMVESGVASAADIDRAMELGYRHPMGPLKLTDYVGLDVRLAIAEHLHRELGGEQYRPPALLRALVRAGKLGRKSGEGFYRWDAEGPKPKGESR